MVPLLLCPKCGKQTTSRQCRCGNRNLEFRTVFNSPETKTKNYESSVRLFASTAMQEQGVSIMAGLLRLNIVAYFQIPESRLCKKHQRRDDLPAVGQVDPLDCKKLHEGDPHGQRPDADNIAKSICDGCNQVVWPDDSAVAVMQIEKRWSQQPRCEVEVETI